MTLDRSSAPATDAPERSTSTAIEPAYDVDLGTDDAWLAPSIADAITLSPSGAKRLAEPARTRAFVMSELSDVHCTVDAGDGKSIVLDGGLYRAGR
ncbi:MAG TPA: hypothetical protein VID24_03700 [Candidatus Eremiobacteraceae bacterium]